MTLPGQPGSPTPAGPNWLAREVRRLAQQIEQLRGQMSKQKTSPNVVRNVTVSGSVLTVTFGDGTKTTYQLP